MELETAFAALADKTRLGLVRLLASGPRTATDLFTALGISQPRASRHLRILREAGLVVSVRRGRWVHFKIADDEVAAQLCSLVVGKPVGVRAEDAQAGASLATSRKPPPRTQDGRGATPEPARGAAREGSTSPRSEASRPLRSPCSSDIEDFLL